LDDSTESRRSEPGSEIESATDFDADEFDHMSTGALVSRSAFGGVLMGLANLVPGISGGTMLLAAGIYPRFIDSIAEVTRFRIRYRSLLVLTSVVGAAGVTILLLAGTLKDLVVDYRWVMYSIFIGLTLGGLPVVWKLAKPVSKTLIIGAIVAFIAMVALVVLQAFGVVGNSGTSAVMLFVAGLAGASAMILPGISGGYLLLLMGQYVPILTAIDEFKSALKLRDVGAAMGPALSVVLPVGLGVVTGVVVVGNLLQWLLHHCRKATLGVLMGLLLGSTVGLWPFQQSVPPRVGDTIKGQVVSEATLAEIEPDDWATRYFRPTLGQSAGALGLAAIGFGLTLGIARIGADEK
jgi:putative membrane protein